MGALFGATFTDNERMHERSSREAWVSRIGALPLSPSRNLAPKWPTTPSRLGLGCGAAVVVVLLRVDPWSFFWDSSQALGKGSSHCESLANFTKPFSNESHVNGSP